MMKIITIVIGKKTLEVELTTWEQGSAVRVVDDVVADDAKTKRRVAKGNTRIIGHTPHGVLHWSAPKTNRG
jgi:hypothetical protein